MLLLQLLVDGVLLGGMYMLLAQGLNLVFGVMGAVNLAHGALITLAGLFTFWFVTETHRSPFLILPVVFVVMLVAGAGLQRFLLEPLARAGKNFQLMTLMVTFGLSYVLVEGGLDIFGSQYVSLPDLQKTWPVGGIAISEAFVVAGLLGAAITGCLQIWLNWTGSGQALLATSQNPIGAMSCGIDVGRVRCVAFAVGTALAGAAGVLLILVIPLAAPTADTLTVLSFVIIALGGLGDYRGAALAALLLGVVQSVAGYYLGGDAEIVIPYLLLIVFMVVLPQGLGRAGRQNLRRAMTRLDARGRRGAAIAGAIIVALAVAAAPFLGSAYILQLATDILTYGALAYSWNLISGCTGYLSFGQVAFFGIGAYATSLLVIHTSIPWYVAVPLASPLAAIAAALAGTVMLRLRGIMFALGMLGLARILGVAVQHWPFAGGAVGLTLPAQLTPVPVYFGMWVAALVAFGLNAFVLQSRWGLAAMGVRDDEGAAAALGVPTTRIKVIIFMMSALAPAAVGGLVAWNRSFLDPASAFDPSLDLEVVVFALFGGIGTLWGPAIGTFVLMLVSEELWAYVPELQLALYGVLVIAVVLAFPGGAVGLANRFGWLLRRPVLAPAAFPSVTRLPASPATGTGPVLEVRDLTVRFGGVVALNRISLTVGRGEVVTIIGANGAGKTTLFNAITGFVVPTEGSILYQGASVVGVPSFRRARDGIARTFQIPRLMETLTVWENALLAGNNGRRASHAVEQAAWALETVGLERLWLEPADKLTPGQRRRLELARALALDPTLILLDEVMAGMTRAEHEEIRAVLRRLREFGVAAVAGVEHVISAIADLSDRMIVLDHGTMIAEGAPEAVLRDPAVIESYLGAVQ